MEIKHINKDNYRRYTDFVDNLYKKYPNCRYTSSRIIKNILLGKSALCKSCEIKAISVYDKEKIVGVCMLVIANRMSEYLQAAFLEFEDDDKIVKKILSYAVDFAKSKGIKKIVFGLNIHVNYGLGILDNKFENIQSLGSAYNPPYYSKYLFEISNEQIELTSFLFDIKQFDFKGVEPKTLDKIRHKFKVVSADFKNLEKTARIYNYINNEAFKNHIFYYERDEKEDIELFNEYKSFLKKENLLFVYKEDEPIGCMLWYPDIFELIDENEKLGISTILKYKFFPHKIRKMKVSEICVIPKYQNSGAILALFYECYRYNKDRYEYFESGWILESNIRSKNFGIKWEGEVYKKYKVFIYNI